MIPIMRVKSGVIEFVIPTIPEGIWLIAIGNKTYGIEFPKNATIIRCRMSVLRNSRIDLNAKIDVNKQAKIIRAAPIWTAENPIKAYFIMIKDDPQTSTRLIKIIHGENLLFIWVAKVNYLCVYLSASFNIMDIFTETTFTDFLSFNFFGDYSWFDCPNDRKWNGLSWLAEMFWTSNSAYPNISGNLEFK